MEFFEVRGYKHANQKLYASIQDGHNYDLYSYGTLALSIRDRKITHKLKYSLTTSCHIGKALKYIQNKLECEVKS